MSHPRPQMVLLIFCYTRYKRINTECAIDGSSQARESASIVLDRSPTTACRSYKFLSLRFNLFDNFDGSLTLVKRFWRNLYIITNNVIATGFLKSRSLTSLVGVEFSTHVRVAF